MSGRIDGITARLRHRITLQKPVLSGAGGGQYELDWTDVATVWAEVEPYISRNRNLETLMDMQLTAVVSHEVLIRYRSGVSAEMRVKFGARIFNIRNVINPGERNHVLRLLVDEHVAQ